MLILFILYKFRFKTRQFVVAEYEMRKNEKARACVRAPVCACIGTPLQQFDPHNSYAKVQISCILRAYDQIPEEVSKLQCLECR